MSLKAKIEAVIYAAEEPVTLAQLTSIFLDEVLAAATTSSLPFEVAATDSEENLAAEVPAVLSSPEQQPPAVGNVAPVEDDEGLEMAAEADPRTEQAALPMDDSEAKKRTRLREREGRMAVQGIVEGLIADYAGGDRGMEIREIAGGYRMATKAEYHDAVRSFVKTLKPQMKLSLQALETLAVIAYKQPVTAPEISEIRGVDTSGVLGGLISRKLITTAGRKQVIGRPILYKTTKEFLLRFGLKDVSELPSMEEFEKMAADMAESDASDLEAMPSDNALISDVGTETSSVSVSNTVVEETSSIEPTQESSGPKE